MRKDRNLPALSNSRSTRRISHQPTVPPAEAATCFCPCRRLPSTPTAMRRPTSRTRQNRMPRRRVIKKLSSSQKMEKSIVLPTPRLHPCMGSLATARSCTTTTVCSIVTCEDNRLRRFLTLTEDLRGLHLRMPPLLLRSPRSSRGTSQVIHRRWGIWPNGKTNTPTASSRLIQRIARARRPLRKRAT